MNKCQAAYCVEYLHEKESAVQSAGSFKDKRDGANRQRLSINKLNFSEETIDVHVENEVGIICIAFVTIDVVADTSPTLRCHTTLTCQSTYIRHLTCFKYLTNSQLRPPQDT